MTLRHRSIKPAQPGRSARQRRAVSPARPKTTTSAHVCRYGETHIVRSRVPCVSEWVAPRLFPALAAACPSCRDPQRRNLTWTPDLSGPHRGWFRSTPRYTRATHAPQVGVFRRGPQCARVSLALVGRHSESPCGYCVLQPSQGPSLCGRYWDRTSDLCRVKVSGGNFARL